MPLSEASLRNNPISSMRAVFNGLDEEAVKESLRAASDEVIQKIAAILTENQYQYAIQTLPPIKADLLKNSRLAWLCGQNEG